MTEEIGEFIGSVSDSFVDMGEGAKPAEEYRLSEPVEAVVVNFEDATGTKYQFTLDHPLMYPSRDQWVVGLIYEVNRLKEQYARLAAVLGEKDNVSSEMHGKYLDHESGEAAGA